MNRKAKEKPGPNPEVLKIEDDPAEALRKLLSTPPPNEDESIEDEDENTQGD